MNYLYLILVIFIVLLITFKCYIKIKYKFWSRQPVFHTYDLHHWLHPKGIINPELPNSDKYCNFISIWHPKIRCYRRKRTIGAYQNIGVNKIFKDRMNIFKVFLLSVWPYMQSEIFISKYVM